MAGRLAGRRIIITGAVDNIGKAVARAFIAEGGRVVIGDIDRARGEAVAALLGPDSCFIHVDVRHEQSVAQLIEAGLAWLGGLDVLVQNAGVLTSGSIEQFEMDQWDQLFAVNVRAQFLGARYAVGALRACGHGSIINTSSLAGKRGAPGLTGYAASKGAVIAFTTTLALELAPDRIRVNAICPGWIDTEFNQPIIDFMGGRARQRAKVETLVPLGREGTPAELAPLFVFLASDESSYVTAQAILADGGAYNS